MLGLVLLVLVVGVVCLMNQIELLTSAHDIDGFDCGVSSLNDWLQRYALKNQDLNVSRTFVLSDDGRVIGYYCLSANGIDRNLLPKNLARGKPNPVPVVLLGRLGVSVDCKGRGFGSVLLEDSFVRVMSVLDVIGFSSMLVHALDDGLIDFYVRHGFIVSPEDSLILFCTIKEMREVIG